MATASKDHLVFEVRLEDAKPQPWRRFSLPADSTFFDLHVAIQDACGWTDTHLWLFLDEEEEEPIAGVPADDEWNRGEGSEVLAGKWRFPPEDCGGIPGYEQCLEAVRTGKDPEGDEEFLEWIGDWRPDAFNLEKAQKAFKVRSIAGW